MDEFNKEIFIIDKNNNKIKGEIEFTFEANGDNFAIYSINEIAYCGKIDEEGNLKEIQEDEWPLVEKIFNDYMERENGGK